VGVASFALGDIGQRIILKSGLLPIRTPGRKISFIINNKKKRK
jgi:phosphate transport system substrate-binding protein